MSETGSRPKIRWIVALAGMLVVPIGGLVWAAVGRGGVSSSDETIAAEDGEADDGSSDETTPGKAGKKKKKSKSKSKSRKATATRAGARKATHAAAPCCEALRAAGNEDPDISNRPTYLAAASACEAAPTAKRALSSVRSIVEGSRHELPSECKEDD